MKKPLKLLQRKHILLSEGKPNFLLYPSTVEESSIVEQLVKKANKTPLLYLEANKECHDLIGVDIKDLIAYGTGDVTRFMKTRVIQSTTIRSREIDSSGKLATVTKKSFKCFQGLDWEHKHNDIILHEDAGSSWNCAIEALGNPEALILIQSNNN